MNALVQDKLDVDRFKEWYQNLNLDERSILTCGLFDYGAHDYTGTNWSEIVQLSGLNPESPLLAKVLSFEFERGLSSEPWSFQTLSMLSWIRGINETERFQVFMLGMYLFGINEGHRFASCNRATCQHWWHQDLKNPQVVRELLKTK
jgi:hypothetical protein